MRAKELYRRVDREDGEIQDKINPWKVLGWGMIVFALAVLGVYLWHIFHGHDLILTWKQLAILSGAGGVIGGTLVTRGGDSLAQIIENRLSGES